MRHGCITKCDVVIKIASKRINHNSIFDKYEIHVIMLAITTISEFNLSILVKIELIQFNTQHFCGVYSIFNKQDANDILAKQQKVFYEIGRYEAIFCRNRKCKSY